MWSTESCTDQLDVDWDSGGLSAQAETDEARIEGARHTSAAKHWPCDLSDDKVTNFPELEKTFYIFFSEKKKKNQPLKVFKSLNQYFLRVI